MSGKKARSSCETAPATSTVGSQTAIAKNATDGVSTCVSGFSGKAEMLCPQQRSPGLQGVPWGEGVRSVSPLPECWVQQGGTLAESRGASASGADAHRQQQKAWGQASTKALARTGR